MEFAHKVQASRYELKYVVDEVCARAIRDFTLCHIKPDIHAAKNPNHEYVVNSLYLDSPDLQLYNSTVTGMRNRYKLRIRFYDNNPASPVFFEIKRRDSMVILKQRASVKRASVAGLLQGRRPRREDLMQPTPRGYAALQHFCELMRSIGATPQSYVWYRREAYESPDSNAVRLTFDRSLMTAPFRGELKVHRPEEMLVPRLEGVVLELKFTNRFPMWMREMVRCMELDRTSVAKYVYCINTLNFDGREAGPNHELAEQDPFLRAKTLGPTSAYGRRLAF